MLTSIAKLFRSTAPAEAIEALARQVSELSLEDVIERVSSRIENMPLSEARGYVRARAAQVVRIQTRRALSQHAEASEDWASLIIPSATERLVPLVIRQTGVGLPRPEKLRMAA